MNLLIAQLLSALVTHVAPSIAQRIVMVVLDVVEDAVRDSNTKTDDFILLPLIRTIRETYSIDEQDTRV